MNCYILYNPLSNRGSGKRSIKKAKKLVKGDYNFIVKSLLDIGSVSGFLASLAKDDRVVIIGGDGTLHRIANRLDSKDIENQVDFLSRGTGNDFARSVNGKSGIVSLNKHLTNLPSVIYNDQKTNKTKILNGVGIGLDGYVCHLVNNTHGKKNKYNYFKNAFRGFMRFKPQDIEYYINDDVNTKRKVKNVWFCAVMNSSYFGGGMKIAPKADRVKKTLQLVVISKIPKWLLVIIFPTIYFGWHTIFSKYVKIYEVNAVNIKTSRKTFMQIDGEDFEEITTLDVSYK